MRARSTPLLRQAGTAECGLACLGMVAGAHGQRWDLSGLRRRLGPGGAGASVADLVAAAATLALEARALRLEPEQLAGLRLPAILHWGLDHFVVLTGVSRRGAWINDPAKGRRRVARDELDRMFTGIAIEARPGRGFQRTDQRRRLRLSVLLQGLEGVGRAIGITLALSLGLQVLILAAPLVVQLVLDRILLYGDRDLLLGVAAGLALLVGLRVGLAHVRGQMLLLLESEVQFAFSRRLLAHLLRLPVRFFAERDAGDVLSRFQATDQIRRTLSGVVAAAMVDSLFSVATLVLVWIYGGVFVAVVLASLGLQMLLRAVMFRRLRERDEEAVVTEARAQGHLLETLRAMRGIKTFGVEGLRRSAWEDLAWDGHDARVRAGLSRLRQQDACAFIAGMEQVAVVAAGAAMVMGGELTVGMLFAVLSYREQLAQRVGALVEQWVRVRLLDLHLERVSDIALEAAEPAASARPRGRAAPLSAQGLGFRYGERGEWLFRRLDLTVEAGACVALTGPSGVGKSTLGACLAGLAEPVEGRVHIPGTGQAGVAALRARVVLVAPEDPLLTGSVAENVAWFAPLADPDRVAACLAAVGLQRELERLPMGTDTRVGPDGGGGLSSGQRARLLLARALYARPEVLVLDEATAHLDLRKEAELTRCLARLPVTRVVITHRPQTLAIADRVYRLDPCRGLARLTTTDRPPPTR